MEDEVTQLDGHKGLYSTSFYSREQFWRLYNGDAYARLNKMTAPTLVVHGEQDVFVPPANALVLAERIPGAQLRLWPDASHMFTIDEPRADWEIARFLLHHSAVRAANGSGGSGGRTPPSGARCQSRPLAGAPSRAR